MAKSASPWRARVLTLYPEMFPGPLGASLPGKALKEGIWTLETVEIRHFASDKHRSVDDTPFGGPAPGDGKGDFQPLDVQFQAPPPDKQSLIVRQCALKAAVRFHSASMELEPETIDDDTSKVLETAERFYQWVITL